MVYSDHYIEFFNWRLHHILGTCTWPRLQSLYLSNKHIDGKELADFVYRHHKTLKSLQLWRVYLRNGNWWTWAESVQPWISSSLERIEFTPSWYEKRFGVSELESECCLKNYILLGHYKRDCCPASRLISKDQTDEEVIKFFSKKLLAPLYISVAKWNYTY